MYSKKSVKNVKSVIILNKNYAKYHTHLNNTKFVMLDYTHKTCAIMKMKYNLNNINTNKL